MMCKKNVAVRVYTWQQHFYGTGDMMGGGVGTPYYFLENFVEFTIVTTFTVLELAEPLDKA